MDMLFTILVFALSWVFILFLSAGIDVALRRLFGIGIWPDNYWRNKND